MKIDLNADLGEGGQFDEALLQIVNSANIACGFHAGSPDIMANAIKLAVKYNVKIGAHPGFPDKENFGRTRMDLPPQSIYNLTLYQIAALDALVKKENATMVHVKPHGMMYNQAAQDKTMALAIAQAVYDFNPNLTLFGLSGSFLIDAAKEIGLPYMNEVFADRRYQASGSLVDRSHPKAMIESEQESIKQVLGFIKNGTVNTIDGEIIPVAAQTVCIHGDGPHALLFAKNLHAALSSDKLE
ncbi:5-oxoprolinase subunit PxpA [Thorsellia kenyensis]|uniref:5-oxoprolinase subunit A n=1 Tax=Thorsellia kenyensis TaxID=1549888 RepID=A0ABV6CCR4_9GAMM